MKINKQMIFDQFKDVTKKDQSKKKEPFTNRIECLKTLKSDIQKNPKNFDISTTQQQFQNLIDDWSAPKPIDAFYKRVFGVTYAEKKKQEDIEYNYVDKKTEDKKPTEETQSIH